VGLEHNAHAAMDRTAAAGDACAAVPERFARSAVRAGRVTLALEQS
jgi:hypothetical protein